MPEFDVVIKDGLIFDGQQTPRWRGDVGIKDGVIAELGRLRSSDAKRVIDARGLHVAPGFIDSHTHYDSQLFWDPYCSNSGWHGVTSVVIGNCGFGFAPVAPEHRERAMLTMARTEAVPLRCMQMGMPWDWVTYPEFLDSIDRAPKSVNILSLMPLNPLLVWVMGAERAKAGELPTDAEHAELRRLLVEALDAGATGFSSRRTGNVIDARDFDGSPLPCDVMHDQTMFELTAVLGERNTGMLSYLYSNRTDVFKKFPSPAVRPHIEQLAEISGRPIVWNLISAEPGVEDWLAWLETCHNRGLTIFAQGTTSPLPPRVFVTFAEEVNLADPAPAWREATVGTLEHKLMKFKDPAVQARMREEAYLFEPQIGKVEDWVISEGCTPETRELQGKTIGEIARAQGKSDVVQTLLDLVIADELGTKLNVPFPTAERRSHPDLRRKLLNSSALPGTSDGGAHTKFRASGSFTTEYIQEFVRELNWITLEEAHWRLSAYTAFCVGAEGRGVLRPGAPADVVVYDYENLAVLPDEIAHDYPGGEWRLVSRSRGYRYVLVNGEITIENDAETAVRSGRLLRGGGPGNPAESLVATSAT